MSHGNNHRVLYSKANPLLNIVSSESDRLYRTGSVPVLTYHNHEQHNEFLQQCSGNYLYPHKYAASTSPSCGRLWSRYWKNWWYYYSRKWFSPRKSTIALTSYERLCDTLTSRDMFNSKSGSPEYCEYTRFQYQSCASTPSSSSSSTVKHRNGRHHQTCRCHIHMALCCIVLVYLALLPAVLLVSHVQSPDTSPVWTKEHDATAEFDQDEESDATLWSPPWQAISEVYVTKEELDFPLAYSIVAYTELKQIMMLLRAIYRPQNFYCIHLDKSATSEMRAYLAQLQESSKMPNLFLIKNPVKVVHSTYTVLEADLMCMRLLLQVSKTWRYFINLTGQEYPRKTNLELVRILKSMNNSNLMSKEVLLPDRVWKRYWRPPPHGIRLVKGSVHIIATRAFSHFAIHDPRAIALRHYLRDTKVPDESFFSTLNHNHHLRAPGGYSGEEFTGLTYPFVNRLKVWWNDWHEITCHGVYVRLICIFGEENYLDLVDEENPALFINKFIVAINGKLLKRIDKWFHRRQKQIYEHPDTIKIDFYRENMPQVTQHF